jgi:hypothetical protein
MISGEEDARSTDAKLPKLHPRHTLMAEAQKVYRSFLSDWDKQFGLTSSEYAWVLAVEVADFLRWCVRAERREDADRENRLEVAARNMLDTCAQCRLGVCQNRTHAKMREVLGDKQPPDDVERMPVSEGR